MMSRWMKGLVLIAVVIGFGSTSVSAQTVTLTATLTGAGEIPPINTGAFGSATVTVNVATSTVTWNVQVFNLPSGVTLGHIHVGAVGTAGPTIVNFTVPTPASNDFAFSGSADPSQMTLRPDQGIRSSDDIIQAILGGNTYVNVHSQVNGGGEIRGQLILR
jgi:hypothetical protein